MERIDVYKDADVDPRELRRIELITNTQEVDLITKALKYHRRETEVLGMGNDQYGVVGDLIHQLENPKAVTEMPPRAGMENI